MNGAGLLLGASVGCLLLSAGLASAAPALPSGGTVAAGSASISSSGASMTVSQSTPKAIIDWSNFSIGQGGSVRFDNGSGATLNRVTETSGSAIDGLLSGTGSVYLINPNGVIVGKTGVVNVGGTFAASTLDVPNANFLFGGDLTFSGPSTASVVNEGKVGALGGDVVLIASSVYNSGSLSAPNGTVGLLAGQSVLLRDQALDGGKFSVLVGGAGTSATNSGLIEAANAELRANGGNVYALAGNTVGVIKANGVNQGDGHVWLVADGGALDVAGTITARGPNSSGGTIETSGADVKIGVSSIDAGVGGTWLVDPYDLTIDSAAANSISGALNAGTNVTEQTTASGASGYGNQNPSGNGDIFVQAPISWSTGAMLTLDAYRNISITAPITVSGPGQVTLLAGSGGHLDFGLGASGFAGSLSFTGTEGSGQSLSINGTAYTLIYSMAELAALSGTSGQDALAGNLAPSATYSGAVVGDFDGTLEGLGHTVNGLMINAPETNDVGLVGQLGAAGSISDIGVVGGVGGYISATSPGGSFPGSVGNLVGANEGSVSRAYATGPVGGSENFAIGGLVGFNSGSVAWSFASGAVNNDGGAIEGGLVGYNTGSIADSYATGPITVTRGSEAGGLVGRAGGLFGEGGGAISNSYATGAITGVDGVGGAFGAINGATVDNVFATGRVTATGAADNPSLAGGFVGWLEAGTISHSYATGRVLGGPTGGGFVGEYQGGSLENDDWNIQTSGRPSGIGSGSAPGVTGLTSAQLEAGLPAGFDSAIWGQIPGVSFPYLKDFYPTTPQVISGVVQMSPADAVTGFEVVATVNGSTTLGSTWTGADGEYYFLEPAGTLPAGSAVVLYIPDVSASTAVEKIAGGASVTGANLRKQYATIISPDTSLSALGSDLSAGLGPATSGPHAHLTFGVSSGVLTVAPNASLQLTPIGAGFDFDQSLNLGSQFLIVSASGAVTQSAGGVTAQLLQGSSVGGLTLNRSDNAIGELHGWTDPTGAVSLTDGAALSVNGAVTAAGASFTTTSGDLAVSQAVRVGTGGVALNSAGKVVESGTKGYISSQSFLNATAVGGLTMNGTNVGLSVALANSGGGAIRYTSYGNLALASASNAGGGTIVLAASLTNGGAATINIKGPINGGTVTLNSPLGIKEFGSAGITATMLNGSAGGPVTLNGSNLIGRITGFTDTAGDFSLKDGEALTLTGTLDGTGRTVSLTTTAGNIAVNGAVDAATLNLTSQAGALTESNMTGAIVAGTLNATAHAGISLGSTHNSITTVGTDHTDAGPNNIQQ